MLKNIFWTGMLIALVLSMPVAIFSQEDRVVQVAIDMLKSQVHLPQGKEIKFSEKKESPIPDFYSVKLLIVGSTQDHLLERYLIK